MTSGLTAQARAMACRVPPPVSRVTACRLRSCGWCKDRWGVSWQITPRVLMEAFTGTDRAAAKRAFNAMMTMKKIDVAAIEAARRG